MGPVRQNPIQRTVRTAHLSVLMTVCNFQYTIQHRTVLIIFTLIMQTPLLITCSINKPLWVQIPITSSSWIYMHPTSYILMLLPMD